VVPTYKNVFDIILEVHSKGGHAKDTAGHNIVQNEVNQRPMRTRHNISPHKLYYGQPPSNSYSTVLGNAYSKATTVLTQLALHRSNVGDATTN
jgi:hypothetical protein